MSIHFGHAFEAKLAELKPEYLVRGVVTADQRVYPLGSDTKVLSSIFELIARPLVYAIAADHKLQVREPRAQNFYPDFTLFANTTDTDKIAIDVKTTYRDNALDWKVSFTLGGYTSFLRNERKSIEFPYSEYSSHWIIGYIYRRTPPPAEAAHAYALDAVEDIPMPFADVDVFVQQKWRIAGDVAGSGNTTNIGSISGTLDDFREGRGVFASESEFLDYWRNYERTKEARKAKFSTVEGFRHWNKSR